MSEARAIIVERLVALKSSVKSAFPTSPPATSGNLIECKPKGAVPSGS